MFARRFRLWPLLLLGVLALLLACRLDTHTEFTSTDQGSFSLSWVMTQEEENMLQSAGAGSAQDLCNEMQTSIQDEASNETNPVEVQYTEADNGDRICKLSVSFNSLDELKKLYGEDTLINRLGVEDGKFYYDVTSSAFEQDTTGLDFPLAITWRVTMPGEVIEHNGDDLQGNTVIWHVTAGEPAHFYAVSKVGGGLDLGSKVWWLVGLCLCLPLLAIVVGVILWLVLRKGKSAKAETTSSPAPSNADNFPTTTDNDLPAASDDFPTSADNDLPTASDDFPTH